MMTRRLAGRNSRGFSLVEMLIVVVIIMIMSTVAVLSYGTYRKSAKISGAADRVKALMIQARTRAIGNGAASRFTVDMDRAQVWLDEFDRFGNLKAIKVIHPEPLGADIIVQEVKIGGVTFTSGVVSAMFLPDGTNPRLTVNVRRVDSPAGADASYYSVQLFPTSSDPKIWPNARK
jgi:prepilin-type N-terminal cleavage/methylation domain-containing protein